MVGRERLLAQLLAARRKRCLTIQGPAGCGKTALLVAWQEPLLLVGFDIAWMTLTPEDNDLTHFLDYLVASLAQVDAGMCAEATLLGGRGMDDETIERTVIALVRGIAAHSADLVLVLDDLHYLSGARNQEAVQWLLDYAPVNLHVVLVSRAAVPISLGRLRDQGLVLELDMRDLRFTAAESAQFLKTHLGDVSQRDARRLHELTDGWVAGLRLLAMREKSKKHGGSGSVPAPARALVHLQDTQAFADYFEREVLVGLSPNEVELLVRMATCERVCAPLCVALFGNGQCLADMRSLLARLESDNLFIVRVEGPGSDTWYRLNPLFRETLLERMRARSEVQQREVHRAAWTWFRDHDQADEAVRHALLAGESSAAADLVLQIAPQMHIRGDLRKLVGLLRLLPVSEVEARTGLRLWMTRLHLYAHEFDACASSIARLRADIPASDADSRYRLTLLEAALAVQRDDTDAAMACLPHLLDAPTDMDGTALGARNNILSWLWMHAGEYERARQIQVESPPILMDGLPLMGTSAGILNGRCLVGFSYALEGKFVQVERICRDVLFDADQRGSSAAEPACLSAALLGEALYEFNDPEAALKLLEDRVDVLERVSIPDSVLRVLIVLSAAHWVAGHRLDAFAYLERLEEYALQRNLSRLVAHSVAEQIDRHLLCGQFEAAEAGLTRLDGIVDRALPAQSGMRVEIEALAARAHISWCIAHEDFDSAAARLHGLIALCEERGWQRQTAHFQMQAAAVEFRRGRLAAGRLAVLAALRRGHRLGLVRSLIDADAEALKFITQVVESEPPDPLLSFYVSRLQAAQQPAPPDRATSSAPVSSRKAVASALAALSERESKVIGLLAQALPNKMIARTLGISPETVKWHLKNIYGKLGVASRHEAVARIRDLELDCGPG